MLKRLHTQLIRAQRALTIAQNLALDHPRRIEQTARWSGEIEAYSKAIEIVREQKAKLILGLDEVI